MEAAASDPHYTGVQRKEWVLARLREFVSPEELRLAAELVELFIAVGRGYYTFKPVVSGCWASKCSK
jgi:hypothetical protein